MVNYYIGKTPPRKEIEYWSNGSIPWVSISDLIDYGSVTKTKEYVNDFAAKNTFKERISKAGTLLMSFKLTVGKVSILGMDAFHNEAIISIYPFVDTDKIVTQYLFNVLPLISKAGDTKSAIKGKTLNSSSLDSLLIPLPPLMEQKRISDKIQKLTPLLKKYDIVDQEIIKHNNNFPKILKKSILQEAIQGKLVPQNPSDEPASVLLERIREEKQRLIKEGKIKKDKNESIIYRRDNSHYEKRCSTEVCIDAEIPFEIPENWCWCRASSLGKMIRGRGIKRAEITDQGCPCIRYGEIYTAYEISFIDTISFIPASLDKDCLHFTSGDVVFTLTGENKVDIAKTIAFLGDGQIAAGGDLAFWTHHEMNPLYLVYYMASPYCIDLKCKAATGNIIVHISTTKVGDFLIPVPPLAEQERIISAIERLFAIASAL
ncbi:MAG TPA: restriction endonuclease subunit S [Candidatus Merdenecus merdavium]|nr:restriction endonuclease subunit S [Candidatus Merdenecus merdavium]